MHTDTRSSKYTSSDQTRFREEARARLVQAIVDAVEADGPDWTGTELARLIEADPAMWLLAVKAGRARLGQKDLDREASPATKRLTLELLRAGGDLTPAERAARAAAADPFAGF